jgi:N-acetylmuramoyl-L-alanine amidase
MKYGIDCGHNCPPDTGCVAIKKEDSLTLAIGKRVIVKLGELGHEVIDCKPSQADTVSQSLAKRCLIANKENVDVFVSIHFNCFNGAAFGSEVYFASDAGERIARSVLAELVKLGFHDRGVKHGSEFYVLRKTAMTAILIETAFCDSQKDMDLFARLGPDAIADAIVKGLTGKLPDEIIDAPSICIE